MTKSSDEQKTVQKTVWETLSAVDVSGFTEKKNDMTYLSWAHAWGVLKKHYPDATFEKIMFNNAIKVDDTIISVALPYVVDPGGYAYVSVKVNAGGSEAQEVFPVLNYNNKPVQYPNSFEVNTALQRCLAKSIGFLGLGHYIYAGEDLPIEFDDRGDDTVISDTTGSKHAANTVSGITAVFEELIPLHDTLESLNKFYTLNAEAMDILQKRDPNEYSRIVGLFSKQKKTIMAAEKKDKEGDE